MCQGMAATAEQSCRRGDAGTSRCRHASPACWPLPHAFRRPLPAMARTPQASCPLTWASPMHGACCERLTVHAATAKTTRDWLHLRSSAMPPPRAARCSFGWYSMVTRFAECPDIVATPTWLEASMTSTGIFSRVPMAISVRNTGRRHLPCGADRVRKGYALIYLWHKHVVAFARLKGQFPQQPPHAAIVTPRVTPGRGFSRASTKSFRCCARSAARR